MQKLIAHVYSRLSWGKSGGTLPKGYEVFSLKMRCSTLWS